jgi:aerobic-type carbon monoxide dehydrogenase small subunit (CoxS/CutS family)
VVHLELTINGKRYEVDAPEHWTLNDVLRGPLGLTGTKRACDYGGCGACTVLRDGVPIYSCVTLAVEAQGWQLTTIEGIAEADGTLHPVQRAFADHYAAQCGWCTPAMIVTSIALLNENKKPTEMEVREALSGVLCRRTGYGKILVPVHEAAAELRGTPWPIRLDALRLAYPRHSARTSGAAPRGFARLTRASDARSLTGRESPHAGNLLTARGFG